MSEEPIVPTKKKPRGKPFVKGGDSRRWEGGPRKSSTALRHLAQTIASERIEVEGAGEMERVEAILREWAHSDNPILAREFMSIAYGRVGEQPLDESSASSSVLKDIPADLIAPDFLSVYRHIKSGRFTEFVLDGGRGSTKSSFISLSIIFLLVNNPEMHGLILRQVGNTLRDSVFSQMLWAIDALGLNDKFRSTLTPMEIEFIATGQKLYFRGADDPGKLKSLKPRFGHIGIVWFEELDQYHGPEAVRKIEQSVMRGGSRVFLFKSFNPPRTANNWANRYVKVHKESMLHHHSDYRTVPPEWLGEPWLAEADHLRKVNPEAYEHEYLGVPNFAGGMIFGNVNVRKITEEERKEFDRVLNGLDFGFYPDPAHFVRCHYDSARMTLYIFKDVRKFKTSNENLYKAIQTEANYEDWELLTCDSAEPKSIADLRGYGATARGAEKGKESLNYSMKWLQSLRAIVIDPEGAPNSATEFLEAEYEQTKDGEVISAYPDRNNHAIDAVRYATNLIWKRRDK